MVFFYFDLAINKNSWSMRCSYSSW